MYSELMDIGDCRFADGFDIGDGDSPFFADTFRLPQPIIPSPRPRIAPKKKSCHEALHLEDTGVSIRQQQYDIQCFSDKIYDPYVDYFHLSSLDQEYTGRRGELCSPTSDVPSLSSDGANGDRFGLQILVCAKAAEKRLNSDFYRLEEERLRSFEEFSYNGVAYDLDEYDKIQQKIRGQEPPTREIPVVPNDKLKEYLWHKHCKTVSSASTTEVNFGKKKNKLICVFCKNNKEPQNVYTGHVLKDARGYTMCPVLRKYPCPICQAIGDHAHTIKYCPFNNDSEFRTSPSPLRTSRMATGKKRR